jgi:hypothetical protein
MLRDELVRLSAWRWEFSRQCLRAATILSFSFTPWCPLDLC